MSDTVYLNVDDSCPDEVISLHPPVFKEVKGELIRMKEGGDIIWKSPTEFSFARPLNPGDVYKIG